MTLRRSLPASLSVVLALLLPGPMAAAATAATAPAAAATAAVSARVAGNALVDGAGHALRLRGVNRSGSEFACAQGWGVFDGPTDDAAIAAMATWGGNAVRLPLNEGCWLGSSSLPAAYTGQPYRDAVAGYVTRLHAAGFVVVLDLHWSAPGTSPALGQQVMADADHAPAFWSSVATRFRADPGVVFDLYNEPHDITWQCWRDGCATADGWRTAGMQSLVDAVRATGATQPLLAGGTNWAGDLSQWLGYRPVDPAGQLAASAHIYNVSGCNTPACWDASIAPVARVVPVVTGEVGSNDCAAAFLDGYLDWADAHGVGYLGWTWNTWDCRTGPALINSYDGTPTPLGAALRRRLLGSGTGGGGTPHLLYDFEHGAAPWRAETPGATVATAGRAHSGAAGLRVTHPAEVSGSARLRVNDGGPDGGGLTVDPAAGGLLTAWAWIPADAPGSGWCADLQLQDAGWSWHGGTCVPLPRGRWTLLSYRPDAVVWPGHRAVGVEFRSAQSGTGPLRASVDDVRQAP